MKKIMYLMFYILIAKSAWSQELHVDSGGGITTSPGSVLYVGNNVSVDAAGSLTVNSDATLSGSLIVTGNATGNISYKRFVTGSDWHVVSLPVEPVQDIPTFVGIADNGITQSPTSGSYSIAFYKNTNSDGNRWTYHNTSPSEEYQETLSAFDSNKGYTMRRPSDGQLTFTGTMKTTDVTVPLVISSGAHFWSCIGNPYPSFLPVNDNANAVSNIIKDNASKFNEAYAFIYVWNGTDFTPKRHSDPAYQLAPGEAFMVIPKSNNETFTFSEAIQNHQSGATTFFKSSSTIPKISLNLTNGAINKVTKLEFLDNATLGLDLGYDAGAYQDGEPSFSLDTHLVTDSEGVDFTIQSLPLDAIDSDVAIPLSIRAAVNEEITFSISSENIASGVSIYLEDTLNNTFVNLTESSFTITIENALQGIGRFYIHTSSSVLSTENTGLASTINVYKTSNHMLRITGLNSQGNTAITMYQVNGKEVFSNQFVAQRVNDVSLPTGLSTGIYLVKVVSENGESLNKKIIIE